MKKLNTHRLLKDNTESAIKTNLILSIIITVWIFLSDLIDMIFIIYDIHKYGIILYVGAIAIVFLMIFMLNLVLFPSINIQNNKVRFAIITGKIKINKVEVTECTLIDNGGLTQYKLITNNKSVVLDNSPIEISVGTSYYIIVLKDGTKLPITYKADEWRLSKGLESKLVNESINH